MIKNKDILKKVEKIIEIGNIKDRKIIKNIIGYGFEKRKIETREKEERDKLSISLAIMESLGDLFIYKKTQI